MKHRFHSVALLRLRSLVSAGQGHARPFPLAALAAACITVSLAAYAPAGPGGAGTGAGGASSGTPVSADTSRPRSGAGDGAGSPAAARAAEALDALAPHVARVSRGDALRIAFEAYYRYREAHPADVRKPYLYFVDLGLDNATPRGWVFDMDSLTVVEGAFHVAHGRGSGPRHGTPMRFSNAAGSYASSLGLYLAQETYTFTGKTGGRRYASVGLKLRGESGAFNGSARARGVVAHGAPYVTSREAGRSEGCPAMEVGRAARVLPLIANGGVVFIYSPNDARWLAGDPWITATATTAVVAVPVLPAF